VYISITRDRRFVASWRQLLCVRKWSELKKTAALSSARCEGRIPLLSMAINWWA
jgi:hypothetical protein